MERTRFVVDHADSGWQLVREGDDKPLGNYKTKEQAVSRGREIAKRRGHSQLLVKGQNHVIQFEWTYGQDPRRHRG